MKKNRRGSGKRKEHQKYKEGIGEVQNTIRVDCFEEDERRGENKKEGEERRTRE